MKMLHKFRKVKAMHADELRHRLRERWRIETDRLRYYAGRRGAPDCEFSSFKDYLNAAPAQRFYPSTRSHDAVCKLISLEFEPWLERAMEDAERILQHRVDVLAYTDISLGPAINWHRDPVSKYEYPQGFFADFDLVHSSPSDPKVINQLNRHQHLPQVAKAFFLTGDERYAHEALVQMESWIDQNPQWGTVNWRSSLDIALRAISWMWAIFFILPSRSFDERLARKICKSLFSQLEHIHRYPSTYSSPNTHLIGEAAALFMGGLLFSEVPGAADWRQFGSIVLMNEMQRQVWSDGVHCEVSSYYHCYTADFYLHSLALARWNRFAFPDWMWNRLSQMLEFVMHASRPDGSIPLLGDDDGGRVLVLSARTYESFQDGLCCGAVLFGRGDFKSQTRQFHEEALWLLGEAAWPIFNSLPPRAPLSLGQCFQQAGYIFQRSGWTPEDTHVSFDCGGLGLPTGGHGHADALSITLFTGGRELLVDPGTSVYNCAPQWRNFFRSTRAHNTVVVDGASQSETSDTFAWKTKSNVRLSNEIVLPGIEYFDGEHDGYTILPHQVTHRRRLIYVRPNYWIVLDDLRGTGDHEYEFFYHFAPDAELMIVGDEHTGEVECHARVEDAGLQIVLYGSDRVHAQAICGQTDPPQGWASRGYGDRRPAPVLRATMHGFPPAAMMSLLIPGKQASPSRRLQAAGGRAIVSAIRDGEYDDIAVMPIDDAELRLVNSVMRGEFFWMRMKDGVLKQLFAVNARTFSYAGETVLEEIEPAPYLMAYFWDNGAVIQRGEEEGKVYVRDFRDRQFQRN
jgi:hypothetical protein